MAKRHRWGPSYRDDRWQRYCEDCGALMAVPRFTDSKVGAMNYWQPNGALTRTAGPCEPKEREADGG